MQIFQTTTLVKDFMNFTLSAGIVISISFVKSIIFVISKIRQLLFFIWSLSMNKKNTDYDDLIFITINEDECKQVIQLSHKTGKKINVLPLSNESQLFFENRDEFVTNFYSINIQDSMDSEQRLRGELYSKSNRIAHHAVKNLLNSDEPISEALSILRFHEIRQYIFLIFRVKNFLRTISLQGKILAFSAYNLNYTPISINTLFNNTHNLAYDILFGSDQPKIYFDTRGIYKIGIHDSFYRNLQSSLFLLNSRLNFKLDNKYNARSKSFTYNKKPDIVIHINEYKLYKKYYDTFIDYIKKNSNIHLTYDYAESIDESKYSNIFYDKKFFNRLIDLSFNGHIGDEYELFEIAQDLKMLFKLDSGESKVIAKIILEIKNQEQILKKRFDYWCSYFKNLNPKYYFSLFTSYPSEAVVMAAANFLGIKTISTHHGLLEFDEFYLDWYFSNIFIHSAFADLKAKPFILEPRTQRIIKTDLTAIRLDTSAKIIHQINSEENNLNIMFLDNSSSLSGTNPIFSHINIFINFLNLCKEYDSDNFIWRSHHGLNNNAVKCFIQNSTHVFSNIRYENATERPLFDTLADCDLVIACKTSAIYSALNLNLPVLYLENYFGESANYKNNSNFYPMQNFLDISKFITDFSKSKIKIFNQDSEKLSVTSLSKPIKSYELKFDFEVDIDTFILDFDIRIKNLFQTLKISKVNKHASK